MLTFVECPDPDPTRWHRALDLLIEAGQAAAAETSA